MRRCTFVRSLSTTFGIILVGIAASSCMGHRSSPWEYGPSLRFAPSVWDYGDEGATIHPVVQYAYLNYDGGHENFWAAGIQVRKPTELFGDPDAERPYWIAGEVALALLQDSYSFGGEDFSESYGGVAVTGFVGKPIGSGDWEPSVFGGFGFSHFGGTGINVMLGVDFQPPFLRN